MSRHNTLLVRSGLVYCAELPQGFHCEFRACLLIAQVPHSAAGHIARNRILGCEAVLSPFSETEYGTVSPLSETEYAAVSSLSETEYGTHYQKLNTVL